MSFHPPLSVSAPNTIASLFFFCFATRVSTFSAFPPHSVPPMMSPSASQKTPTTKSSGFCTTPFFPFDFCRHIFIFSSQAKQYTIFFISIHTAMFSSWTTESALSSTVPSVSRRSMSLGRELVYHRPGHGRRRCGSGGYFTVVVLMVLSVVVFVMETVFEPSQSLARIEPFRSHPKHKCAHHQEQECALQRRCHFERQVTRGVVDCRVPRYRKWRG